MKTKIVALAIVLVMVLSGAIILVPGDDITWDTLKDDDPAAYVRAKAVSTNENVTIEDAANFTLYRCGLSDEIAGKTQFDRRSMISYSGILDNINKEYSERATRADLTLMLSNAVGLKSAYSNGTPYFHNGLALPVFGYTIGTADDYSNTGSSIIRYCVYVETGYDTDSDGKRDLVKVFLQIPRSAVEGKYKAPVLLECNPYAVGSMPDGKLNIEAADSYDLSKLYSQPAARTPTGSVDPMTLALSAKSTDWKSKDFSYSTQTDYDHYLVRGYAVAICCGLGSYGSEGFVCTGTDIELSAYRNVVEWFDGKATAFSDTSGCRITRAEWSNGNVGTSGMSYLGTIQLGLSAVGIPNLKTVVPLGAIVNWYEYSNCQGCALNRWEYIYYLSGLVSSRYIKSGFTQEYIDYLAKLRYDESLLKGNYTDGHSDFWSSRDYRNMELRPGTSILLVEGLNEYNVRTKQFDMAYDLFTNAGYTVKAILHQGMHQELTGGMYYYDLSYEFNASMDVDGQSFYDILNMWYSHYLFGIDNGAEDLRNVQIQSNTDGSWSYRDDLGTSSSISMSSVSIGTNTISKKGYDADPTFKTISDDGRSAVTFEIKEDTTLFGIPEVTVRASISNVINDAMMAVVLYDVCDDGMDTSLDLYKEKDVNLVKKTGYTMWIGSSLENCDIVIYNNKEVTHQLITSAVVDMNNPSSDYESKTSVPETIQNDTYYEYHVYLNPTVYTIREGHTLAVVVYTADPENRGFVIEQCPDYSLTIDEGSIKMSVNTL